MNKAEAVKRLRELQGHVDTEVAHVEADKILCELLIEVGFADVVVEWDRIDKWYA